MPFIHTFFTYMCIGYILFFRAFFVALQETITTPRTLEEGLGVTRFYVLDVYFAIFLKNKMKIKTVPCFDV